ncbi:MAG TPA: hypothetical protein EYH31_00480 [Anaerolineae bacterium]|nr:hypothetical protein [Anaerolineae bacterium]
MQNDQFRKSATLFLVALTLVLALGAPVGKAAESKVTPTPTPLEAPQLLSPADGVTTTGLSDPPTGTPSFSWAPVDGAFKYHVQISSSAGFATIIEESDTYATSWTPLKALADGVYYWRVRAEGMASAGPYSAPWRFTKDWSADGAIRPQLLSPPSGATRTVLTGDDFSWTPVPGAARYLLEIDDDPAFNSLAYSAQTIKPRHTPESRLANSTYYWRVTPVDHQEHYGLPSEPSVFTMAWGTPPQLLSPDHNVVVAFTPAFRWTAVEGARSYVLEISTTPDFGTSTSYQTSNTSFTPQQSLANDQDYYWRVKALDNALHSGAYSEVRRFEIRWDAAPRLLAPVNNRVSVPDPFFAWTPVAGAKEYQLQVDESAGFAAPLKVDIKTAATTYQHSGWGTVTPEGHYFWRVRAVNNQKQYTPWSEVRSFDFALRFGPNLIYPPPYYVPDATSMPSHDDPTVGAPLFLWNTVHDASGETPYPAATHYELLVDDDPTFSSPNFQVTTAANGAAPTVAQPFADTATDGLYYWRVRAYNGTVRLGTDAVWLARIDTSLEDVPATDEITLIYPADGHEVVVDAPVLGWQPVRGAARYQVQIARDAAFTTVVEEAEALYRNYVPGQNSTQRLPSGTYYWRVRALDAAEAPLGNWSEVRHFNLSHRLLTGNPFDYELPTPISDDPMNRIVQGPDEQLGKYELTELYLAQDRSANTSRLDWVLAATTAVATGDDVDFAFYVDMDHEPGSGGGFDPLGKPFDVPDLYLPDYIIYAHVRDGTINAEEGAFLWTWNGLNWGAPQSLYDVGGAVFLEGGVLQLRLPYTGLGAGNPDWVGSVAIRVSTSAPGASPIQDMLPDDPLGQFAFSGDLLNPIYPFDTPLSNPIVYHEVPPMRWLMPYWDSVDGYQVQVARDRAFTDIVQEWEVFESGFVPQPQYEFLSTSFTPMNALPDNETYYWRVRVRHEQYLSNLRQYYDYGPWSRPFRFKLESRVPTNLRLDPGGSLVYRTPTFEWDRVQGAAAYRLQVDDDVNFSSPLVNKDTDNTSFTPTDGLGPQTVVDGTYYWRVAIQRGFGVYGKWSGVQSFTKISPTPQPLAPAYDEVLNELPTFRWTAVLTPTDEPRLAAPRYQLLIDDDPNFGTPIQVRTEATSFTPAKNLRFPDGTWYWKVAMLNPHGQPGPYSPVQRFYKEYLSPQPTSPAPGASSEGIPTFVWEPLDGAAYYHIEVDDDEQFFLPKTKADTDQTTFTPTNLYEPGEYYWRVRMVDDDGQTGPYKTGILRVGHRTYMPLMTKG